MRRKSRPAASIGRSIGVAEHHRFPAGLTRLTVTRFIALAAIAALILLSAVSAHATTTTDRVAAARAAVDRIATRWFQAENDAAQIDARITDTQRKLDAAQARVNATSQIATARAVELYKTNDTTLNSMFATDALDSARQAELADKANQLSVDDINELTAAVDDLKAQERDLEAQRAHQQHVLHDVANQRAALDAQLTLVRSQADREAAAALRSARDRASQARARARLASIVTAPVSDPTSAPTRDVSSVSTATNTPTPTPPPSNGRVSSHHNDPFLVCTRTRESSGIYSAVSPSGYYGAYQFSPSTWDATAVHAGRMDLVGVLPSRASEYDQDEMAWSLYQWQGNGPWGGRC